MDIGLIIMRKAQAYVVFAIACAGKNLAGLESNTTIKCPATQFKHVDALVHFQPEKITTIRTYPNVRALTNVLADFPPWPTLCPCNCYEVAL